jgi:hypothetical protein
LHHVLNSLRDCTTAKPLSAPDVLPKCPSRHRSCEVRCSSWWESIFSHSDIDWTFLSYLYPHCRVSVGVLVTANQRSGSERERMVLEAFGIATYGSLSLEASHLFLKLARHTNLKEDMNSSIYSVLARTEFSALPSQCNRADRPAKGP